MEKFKSYHKRAEERFKSYGLLPRPINKAEVEEFLELLQGEAVEEKMGADTGLQCCQTGFGDARR